MTGVAGLMFGDRVSKSPAATLRLYEATQPDTSQLVPAIKSELGMRFLKK